MKYTPSQVRQVVGLPQETLRHWRATFAFLADNRGQGPTYRVGQILVLAVIKQLVRDCGISVGALKAVEDALCRTLARAHWSMLATSVLRVRLSEGEVEALEGLTVPIGNTAALLLPLAGVIAQLRAELIDLDVPDPQQSLAFPPLGVSPTAEKVRA